MSKIVRLESSNVKRITAVEITPSGNVVVIGGKNGAGKSSVLDSIEYALGGDPSAKLPVRRGEERARIVVDLGDIVVKRTFTAGGGTSLVVTDSDGKKQSTPQFILDKLVGKLTFDPLAFAREKPKQQAEILRGLVGLDMESQQKEKQAAFDERTAINRDIKNLEARIAGIPKHEGLPDKEESAAAIMEEQQAAAKKNLENLQVREAAEEAEAEVETCQEAIKQAEGNCVELKRRIATLQKEVGQNEAALLTLNKELPGLVSKAAVAKEAAKKAVDFDLAPFITRVAQVEEINRKVRQIKERADLVVQLRAKTKEADALTDKLESIDAKNRKATMEAKYPVEGLLFDVAGGVTYKAIPFDQCSAAEQLKVSVAIGLALNPKLRVLLIRDGSLLDDDSMKVLAEMAEKAQAQIWLERVATDSFTSVVIEDGHVKEHEKHEPEPPSSRSQEDATTPPPTKDGQLL